MKTNKQTGKEEWGKGRKAKNRNTEQEGAKKERKEERKKERKKRREKEKQTRKKSGPNKRKKKGFPTNVSVFFSICAVLFFSS